MNKAYLMIFNHPVWAFLGSWVEIIPLPHVTDNLGSTGICFLHQLTHHHWSHYQDLYLPINQTLVHMPTCYLQTLLGRSLFLSLQAISPKGLLATGPAMVENMVSPPSICLCITMVDGIFFILAVDSFTFIPGLLRPSQKCKQWSLYNLGEALSRTL